MRYFLLLNFFFQLHPYKKIRSLFLLFISLTSLLFGQKKEELHLNALYHSLDQHSIAKLLAFYHLYPETTQGKNALSTAWALLNSHRPKKNHLDAKLVLPDMDLQAMIAFVNKEPFQPSVILSEKELETIQKIGDHLYNRQLKGFHVWTKEALLLLPAEEIDLARALLIYQFDEMKESSFQILQYEASLDLMALQILARLPLNASCEEKIHAINQFIFHEKRFRFPPHSLWAQDIDVYTFLPSVLDNRRGVCLGVSILYLSIAQRLNLPLEIITPPGHIYLRYKTDRATINIETTARGISLPSNMYLGMNTRHLQKRSIKEVIGLALMNQAAATWEKEDYASTAQLYEKALPFLSDDPLLKMLLGYQYLFIGNIKKGKALLKEVRNLTFDHAVSPETTPEDYLSGQIDIEGIKTIFLPVDETRESIQNKQTKLKQILAKYPNFRDGILQLAITELQLSHTKGAIKTLSHYHKLDPNHPTVEYYLSIVSLERLKYQKAWKHLKRAESITKSRGHFPKALKHLRHRLRLLYPDPNRKRPLSS